MSADANPKSETTQECKEQELCTQCLAGNRPGNTFCRECGAPLTSYAATGPFESLFAEGHVYRKATEQPRRFIVVLGIWLIFGSLALSGVTMILLSRRGGSAVEVILGLGLLAISLFLIAKTTKNYCKRQVPTAEVNS
ncbi:MAG: hypothetical protein JWM99_3911 [Verrucomicrobiales bacterium]|nr:hypothetical protein [Verrucomicrobiales bacterium]